MTIDEMIAVLQAAKNGKKMQYKCRDDLRGTWHDRDDWCDNCPFNFCSYDYRIKPEPREWWAHVNADGKLYMTNPTVVSNGLCEGCIKVREVIE